MILDSPPCWVLIVSALSGYVVGTFLYLFIADWWEERKHRKHVAEYRQRIAAYNKAMAKTFHWEEK